MNITSESFIDYLMSLESRPLFYRVGQHMFNMLCDHNELLAEEIRGDSKLDPFYNDNKVPAFLIYVIQNWNKYDKLNP